MKCPYCQTKVYKAKVAFDVCGVRHSTAISYVCDKAEWYQPFHAKIFFKGHNNFWDSKVGDLIQIAGFWSMLIGGLSFLAYCI